MVLTPWTALIDEIGRRRVGLLGERGSLAHIVVELGPTDLRVVERHLVGGDLLLLLDQ